MTVDVHLREVVEDDLPILFEHQADAEAAKMAAFSSRDREAFMAHWAEILANDAGIVRTVVADGDVAGNVMSFEWEGRREVGYWIGREYWGRGVATAALAEFLRLERRRPLHAGVAEHNVGSIRVLEKCGFTISAEEVGPEEDGVAMVHLELRDSGPREGPRR